MFDCNKGNIGIYVEYTPIDPPFTELMRHGSLGRCGTSTTTWCWRYNEKRTAVAILANPFYHRGADSVAFAAALLAFALAFISSLWA